ENIRHVACCRRASRPHGPARPSRRGRKRHLRGGGCCAAGGRRRFDIPGRRKPDATGRCRGGDAGVARPRPPSLPSPAPSPVLPRKRGRTGWGKGGGQGGGGGALTVAKALTHIDRGGAARMVDVSPKPATERVAVAAGFVRMSAATLGLVLSGNAKKGDV